MAGSGGDVADELRKALSARYTVVGAFGSAGGQGSVYRGTCDGHEAAIKAFSPTTDERRIKRELDTLQRLTCPHLVRVLGVEAVRIVSMGEITVVAYELHSGGDLTQHLGPTAAKLSEADLVKIAAEVGLAIDVLWKERIVHRDVKPANIVRAADGRLVLVDLGLARHVDRSGITRPGGAPGTPGFMSPEQAEGRQNLTIHADAFSLGVTLYCLAAREHPFGGRQDVIMSRVVPPRLHTKRPDLSVRFCAAVDKLLSLRPSGRPRNLAAEFTGI